MFLIDACLRTSLVVVAQARGHQADHVTCLGLGDDTGCDLMPRIVAGDFTFATNDARDFHKLYAREEIHVGLVIIVSQVLPAQPQLLKRAVRLVLEHGRKHPDDIIQELRFNARLIESFCGLPAGTLDRKALEGVTPTLK